MDCGRAEHLKFAWLDARDGPIPLSEPVSRSAVRSRRFTAAGVACPSTRRLSTRSQGRRPRGVVEGLGVASCHEQASYRGAIGVRGVISGA